MAFVVILHLSPTHKSSAAEILQRATGMPVRQVGETMPVQANHVYVIPPGVDADDERRPPVRYA
jgi:two-component system CheB/CheR fusion protein